MTFKVGFTVSDNYETNTLLSNAAPSEEVVPRKSVVQVYFQKRNMTLSYYNDLFDLHQGDMVYVDGKLEGLLGRVVEVNYNFKIKISDYKRVVFVVNRNVSGKFFLAGSHFITFDRSALPCDMVNSWFKAPSNCDDEFASGHDDSMIFIDELEKMNISPSIASRGHEYYLQNRVRYISLDNTNGYAIVEGSEGYEVEFQYNNGEISKLVCSCFCSGNCKHEFAVLLQLKETLEYIKKHYADEYECTGYFAAIDKGTLLSFAFDGKETGSFTI